MFSQSHTADDSRNLHKPRLIIPNQIVVVAITMLLDTQNLHVDWIGSSASAALLTNSVPGSLTRTAVLRSLT